ncbi:hypothetical protein G6024_15200 [Dietzia maris]|nr:SIR2 family protein [Dietzia maris]MBB0998411.1 hypothetical protein [Dietzia maris]
MTGFLPGVSELQGRLAYSVNDAKKRIVPVLGSGLTVGAVPNSSELTELFVRELDRPDQRRCMTDLREYEDDVERYQAAAVRLSTLKGPRGVQNAVRKAVLSACVDVDPEKLVDDQFNRNLGHQLERKGTWKLTDSIKSFAQWYSGLPASARGPIFTTNFDPLVEIGLRLEGVSCEAVPLAFDKMPDERLMKSPTSTPVIHLHGYWLSDYSINSIKELRRERPAVSELLRKYFQESTVLVAGYGGWSDTFMETLLSYVEHDDLYDTDVCWSVHSRKESSIERNEQLVRLQGHPAVSTYFGVNAADLFSSTPIKIIENSYIEEIFRDSPAGYTLISSEAREEGAGYNSIPNSGFADGRRPEWLDAAPGVWPMLESSVTLLEVSRREFWGDTSSGVAAIGPMGEGKSLALMQSVVILASENPDWSYIWHNSSAPPISGGWLSDLLEKFEKVCVVVDEVDIVATDVIATINTWRDEGDRLKFLFTCHDRFWNRSMAQVRPYFKTVYFQGIQSEDASALASAWRDHGLSPYGDQYLTVEDVASRIRSAAVGAPGAEGNTLFGAVLGIRSARHLRGRVENLVDKFRTISATNGSDVNLAQIFGAVCFMQVRFDPHADAGCGLSVELIKYMLNPNGAFPDGRALKILGREAFVSFSGDLLYARHLSIAEAVIDIVRESGESDAICRLIGLAGGRAWANGGFKSSPGIKAFRFAIGHSVFLEGYNASRGAIEGSGPLLSSRVNHCRFMRDHDPEQALSYGLAVTSHLDELSMVEESIRVLLNDLSVSARLCHEYEFALALAAASLDSDFMFEVDRKQVSYGIWSIRAASLALRRQSPSRAGSLPELADEVGARLLRSQKGYEGQVIESKFVGCFELREYSSRSLVRKIEDTIRPLWSASAARLGGGRFDRLRLNLDSVSQLIAN